MKGLMDAAIDSVIRHEGGFQADARDRGNWTGGAVGAGDLIGTNYGISAASYPELDIQALTRDDAAAIYARDFWPHVPSSLEPSARWFAFDTAVNSGVGRMRAFVNEDQSVLGLAALRLKFLAGLDAWDAFGRGWTRRVAGVLDDIRAWQREVEAYANGAEVATVVVLHELSLGDRARVAFRREPVLRGAFVWRTREREGGVRLDVRRS